MKKRAFQPAAWAALAAIVFVTVSPIGWRPTDILPVNVDRALAFAALAGLFVFAYPKRWATVAILLTVGAGAIELLQLLSSTRHAQVEDAVVKAAGALLGVGGALILDRLRHQVSRNSRRRSARSAIVARATALELSSMRKLPVTSKAIDSVYFGAADGKLHIRFHDGEVRRFGGVSENEAEAFVTAPSPGQHYIDNIRKRFPRLAA